MTIRTERGLAALLLLAFLVQGLVAIRRDSVTVDEFIHLPVGLHMLRTGDLSKDPVNPPFPPMIAALPLLLRNPALEVGEMKHHFRLGYEFETQNREEYQSLFESSRGMILLLSLFLGLLVRRWATRLYGAKSGLTALFFFAFSPNLLAHGHLVTLDAAGALGFLLATYSFWRLLERPSFPRASLAGAAFGLANLMKLSGVVLAGSIATLVLFEATRGLRARGERGVSAARWALLLLIAAVIALVVLNAGYGFDGTFRSLGEYRFYPDGLLKRAQNALPALPVPLPRPFVRGLDIAMNAGKADKPSYFLAGELSKEGWWQYHLVAFAVKTPLPVLLLALFATAAWAAGRSRGARDFCLFVPVLLLFLANSAFNSLDIGVRHLLPVYPLLWIGIAPHVADRLRGPVRAGTLLAAAAFLWTAVACLSVAPRYLQFFNLPSGGPSRGYRLLIDSNYDWGQDLIRLREQMDENGIDGIALAYFGRVDPATYGIRYEPLDAETSHGVAAVSATFLMGRPYVWYGKEGLEWTEPRQFSWLSEREPIDRVGAMFLYALP
ncbi:MAG: glycosyltransferase family 39 protein [Candidatus Eisenbacteria bacterium]